MAIDEKRAALQRAVADLRNSIASTTPDDRLRRLEDIGRAAVAVDTAAIDHPEADEIRKATDALVDEAESIVDAQDQSEHLERVIPKVGRPSTKPPRL